MEGNVFRKGSSSDFTAFQVFSSRIEARKNILEVGEGNRITQGFFLRGKSDLYLTENEITSKDPKGLLFVLPTDGHTLDVQRNTFSLKGGAYREIRQEGKRVRLRSLKEFEDSSSDREKIRNNRNHS
jgi:hypothetical protein